jgi:hypothetical protein
MACLAGQPSRWHLPVSSVTAHVSVVKSFLISEEGRRHNFELVYSKTSTGERNATLIRSHRTVGGTAYAVENDNRIGNRIDNIEPV